MLNIIENIDKNKAICVCNKCKNNYLVKYKSDAKKPGSKLIYCKDCNNFIRTLKEITQESIREAFTYVPETGELLLNYPRQGKNINDSAISNTRNDGYLILQGVGGKSYLAHRIIFMYMKGYMPKMVDHINHERKDNRWCNLREVDDLENTKNITLQNNSTSKINGVSLHKPTGKYRAYIGLNYKQVHLGLFDTVEEAIEARNKANVDLNYHTNHGNVQGSE